MDQSKITEHQIPLSVTENSPSSSHGSLQQQNDISQSHPSQVTLEEIAPGKDTISDKSSSVSGCTTCCWHGRQQHTICERRNSLNQDENLPKNIKRYYKQQHRLLASLENPEETDVEGHIVGGTCTSKDIKLAVRLSLFCNILLLTGKAFASYQSNSMSIISSLVDSAVDLASGAIIWYTNRSIKGTNYYEYPEGKMRLEPLGIVVLSVVMTVASIQLIITSVTKIAEGTANPDISLATIVIISSTVLIKLLLFLYCRTKKSPLTAVLAQDHRNDVLSNAVALGFGYLGYKVWKDVDPIGAILISLYIAVGWWRTGGEQIRILTGHTAQPALLHKLLWICLHHDRRIQYIDTLRAYHFGYNLLVEAHIVLPPSMTLQEAHDIGEPLQQKLEKFPMVERAFVHIDYEYEHHPAVEHKMGHPSLSEQEVPTPGPETV